MSTVRSQAGSWYGRLLSFAGCAHDSLVAVRRADKQVVNDDIRLRKCERVLEVLEKEIARDIERETGTRPVSVVCDGLRHTHIVLVPRVVQRC